MASSRSEAHIVAVPYPLSGHLIPLLHLCQTLLPLGFTITFLHTQSLRSKLLQLLSSSSHHVQPDHAHRLRLVTLSDDVDLDVDISSWDSSRKFHAACKNLRSVLEPLLETLSPFDFILADTHLGWVQDVANKFGVPRLAFWVSSGAECQVYLHVPQLICSGDLPFKSSSPSDEPDNLILGKLGKRPVYHRGRSGGEIYRLPGLPPLNREEFPTFLQIEDSSDILFQYYVEQAQRIPEAHAVLFNSVLELESRVFSSLRALSVNAYALGPLFLLKETVVVPNSQPNDKVEDRCLSWLDQQRADSVLYVAFGSMNYQESSVLRALAEGLEASQQRFLWAMPSATNSEPFLSGFLERTKERGMVVQWAPQTLVLGHPSVGGFLSHCGWNSFLESISLGVPMIGFPLWADHALVCKLLVEEWRAGIRLKADEDGVLRSEEVERSARELMERKVGEELRKHARQWSAIVKSAIESSGSSRNCLLKLLQGILRPPLAKP